MEKLVLIESKLLIPDRDVSTTSRRHAEEAAEPESVPPELVADNGELGKLRSDNRRLNDTVNRIRKERNELRESASDQLSLQQENERLTDELEKAREEIVRLKVCGSLIVLRLRDVDCSDAAESVSRESPPLRLAEMK